MINVVFNVIWVPGDIGISGNEVADQMAREGSSHPLIGLEPALGISVKVARGVIRDWANRKLEKQWL
jgi:hypothetical protein